jgi:nicotinamidase-related amidase
MCFAYTALHALREWYEVYSLMDAAGDSMHDAHKYAFGEWFRQAWSQLPSSLTCPNGCTIGPTRKYPNS